jgi:hypothetical protein
MTVSLISRQFGRHAGTQLQLTGSRLERRASDKITMLKLAGAHSAGEWVQQGDLIGAS